MVQEESWVFGNAETYGTCFRFLTDEEWKKDKTNG